MTLLNTPQHSLIVVTLPPQHPLVTGDEQFKNIKHTKLQQVSVRCGRQKRPAFRVEPDTIVATITAVSGKTFDLRAGVQGHILEQNESLPSPADFSAAAAMGSVYFALVKPRFEDPAKCMQACITEPKWKRLCSA